MLTVYAAAVYSRWLLKGDIAGDCWSSFSYSPAKSFELNFKFLKRDSPALQKPLWHIDGLLGGPVQERESHSIRE